MAKAEDGVKAVNVMNGYKLNGREMRVEKARRVEGYSKTPGQCKIFEAIYLIVNQISNLHG